MKKIFLSIIIALLILLSTVSLPIVLSAEENLNAGAVYSEDVLSLVKAEAYLYLRRAGNEATENGLHEALEKLNVDFQIKQFFIYHAVNGVFDEATTNALSILGYDGYSSAVISVGESNIGVITDILHTDENLGTLSTEVYATGHSSFIVNSSGYITGYSGTAEKIVIPADYSGRLNWSGFSNDTVKVIVIGDPDGETGTRVMKSFSCFTNLYAVQFPHRLNEKITGSAFKGCSKLRYVKLPHEVVSTNTTIVASAFLNCNNLETAMCTCCGKMPIACYGGDIFTNTAIRSYYLPEGITYASGQSAETVFGKEPSYGVGEMSIMTAEMQKNANLARAAVLAQNAAYAYIAKSDDTADTILSVIESAYNSLEGANHIQADWGNTFKITGEKVSGTISLTDKEATIDILYYSNANSGLFSLDIEEYPLSPAFDPEITEYSIEIPYLVDFVSLRPRPVYGANIISVTGNEALEANNNKIEIKTIASNNKEVIYTVNVEHTENNVELNNKVSKAFNAYVESVGNEVELNGVLAAVNAAIAPATATLSSEEFFIRHAVDGVYDEDSDKSTRLSIPGHDGYVSAVFRISENGVVASVFGTVCTIYHTETNLGVLTKSKDDDFVVDENGDLIEYNGDAQKVIVPSFVRNIVKTGGNKAGKQEAIVLVTKNSGTQVSTSAFRSTDDSWCNLLAADISNIKVVRETAFTWLRSLKYLKLAEDFGGGRIDFGAFNRNYKLENVNIPSNCSLMGNVFTYTAIRDIYEGNGLYRPRKDEYDDYASPSFTKGTRVVMTYSEQQTATFARAATFARHAANSLVFQNSDDEDTILAKIKESYQSYNLDIIATWNNTFRKNGDILSGTITLLCGNARIEIDFYRDNSKAIRDILLTDYELSPAFDADTHNYSVAVKYNATALKLVTNLEPGAQIISIEGNSNFSVGENNSVVITAKANNGDTNVYTIKVTRLAHKSFDEMADSISANLSNVNITNSTSQIDLQTLINSIVKDESYKAYIIDFYKYKAIDGATENGTQVLVPGYKGYITAVVLLDNGSNSRHITVKAEILPEMEDYTFASVSKPEDFEISDDGKTLLTYKGNAEKVVIPEGIEFIDYLYLYTTASGIKCMILPESLRAIPASLCFSMADLEVVYMGDNVVSIAQGAFMNCVSLKHIRLSENLPAIGITMFSHNLSLGQLYIPQSVKKIRSNAFYRSLLRDVTIGKNVEAIESNAFGWAVNFASYFTLPSLGALINSDKAVQIQNNSINKWAGDRAPRMITVLNDEIETVYGMFAGDESGAWGINTVRASENSSITKYMDETTEAASDATAKKYYSYLDMSLSEAAARAQIVADGIHVLKDSTAEDAKKIIDASYVGSTITGTQWKEPYTVSNNRVTGVLSLSDNQGISYDIVIDTKVFVPAEPIPVEEPKKDIEDDDDDWNIDEDFFDEDFFDEDDNFAYNNSNANGDALTNSNANGDALTGEWKTIRKKIRTQMMIPGKEEFYLPTVVWILIFAGAFVILAAGTFVLVLFVKKRKREKDNR